MIDIVSIQFKKTATEPFYQTLAHAIKKQIKREDVPEGERLPAIRTVAERFDLNNATVIAAYRLLEEKGLVYTKQGSGTYTLPAIAPPPKDELTHLFGEYAAYNSQKFTQADGMIDLAGNSPTASIFPVKEFKEAVNAVLDADGGYAFSYQESEGYYPLREILAVFSSVQYGIHCTPEETLITAGAQQALDLISKAILKPGDTVFAEMPSYIGMRSVFALHDARLVGIPVENDGINLNLVAYYAKKYKPRLLYTMPVYQTPTGMSMSAEKRKGLLALAEEYHFYIIEDDLFSDIHLAGTRRFPLKAEDRSGRVLYVKSFSKLLMPGIRTAFLIAPRKMIQSLSMARYATDLSGSGFIQRALAVYFHNGCWESNIAQLSSYYRQRREIALKAAKKWRAFGVKTAPVQGGFGLWLTLPQGITDEEIYRRCKQKEVLVAPGSTFYLSPMAGAAQHLRISFASTEKLEKGLQLVGESLREAVNEKREGHLLFI